jgi:hypothetical protein
METGKTAHVFIVDYFTNTTQPIEEFNSEREQINVAILKLLQTLQIELAASSTDIKLHNDIK